MKYHYQTNVLNPKFIPLRDYLARQRIRFREDAWGVSYTLSDRDTQYLEFIDLFGSAAQILGFEDD
jgi:hypothetical protein